MGRGRAKAKQQKVARELKYSSQSTDLDALQRELGAPSNGVSVVHQDDLNADDGDDSDDDYEDDDRWTGTAR
jgi:hypothetical protein